MKTTILFQRHGEHQNQVIVPEDRESIVATGRALAAAGYKVDRMILSPLPRAIWTAGYTCEGMGNSNVPLSLEPRLGDFKSDPRTPKEAVKALKELSIERYGNDDDANLAKCLIDTPALHELLFLRAQEGALALIEMARNYADGTILVTSHGVARMELVLRYLRGFRGLELLNIADELIERGQVVVVTFDVIYDRMDDLDQAYFQKAELFQPPTDNVRDGGPCGHGCL